MASSMRWTTHSEYINLLKFIIERAENVKSPMRIRVEKLRTMIHGFEHIDTNTKVKVLFALSASVYVHFLEELRKNAFVEVDEKNRIVYYKAIDGSLELRRDHSLSNEISRSMIIAFFGKKDNADTIQMNEEESEMWNLIELISEKCENVSSPLSIGQLTKDFNTKFGSSRSSGCIEKRVKSYCYEIQKTEFLDTPSKVRQLFGLSATLDSECLKEFRKNADVEVDHQNRITKYAAKNGYLTLHGDHSSLAKRKLARTELEEKRNAVKKYCNFGDDDDYNETSIRYLSSSSNRIGSSSNDLMRPNEIDDYDTNYSIDDQIKLEPVFGSMQEDLNGIELDEDVQQVPKPHQAHDEHKELIEFPIKLEHEEPVEVKPETSHNFKIKFFEAMHSLILCLDTPFLSWIQSKILKKMSEIEGSHEMIPNNEIVLIIHLLIARIVSNSIANLSETAESVNLSNFLRYLKAAVLNSKISGVEGLVQNISKLIEESQNKRVPMEKVANALRATLDIDGF